MGRGEGLESKSESYKNHNMERYSPIMFYTVINLDMDGQNPAAHVFRFTIKYFIVIVENLEKSYFSFFSNFYQSEIMDSIIFRSLYKINQDL